jgi:hypothetical protein
METYRIPDGQDKWCGPAALAYLLRSDPDTAANLLRAEGYVDEVCLPEWMFQALKKAGYGAEPVMPKKVPKPRYTVTMRDDDGRAMARGYRGPRFTLARWLQYAKPKFDEEFIIGVTGHWLVIHGGLCFDSACRDGRPLEKCPYLRHTLYDAHRITRPLPDETQELIDAPVELVA